jgi:LysM repeat protein
MKPIVICVAGALGMAGVSCESLKLGGGPSGGVKTDPYEDVENGGYATGDFYGRDTNPYEPPLPEQSDRYAQAYGNQPRHSSADEYDRVSVIPFTDNGSSVHSDNSRGRVASTASEPDARESTAPASTAGRGSTASRRSADVVAAGRGSSGSSSDRASRPRSPADNDGAPRKSAPSRKSVHVVKRGDTLYRISRTYGVPVATLKRRNQLDSDLIRVGEELVIR